MEKDFYYQMGLRANLDLLQEECAELIRACNKYKRSVGLGYPTPCTIEKAAENIIEEIADVEKCIAIVKYLFSINQDDIEKIKAAKDDRMEKRLNGNKG